MTALINEGVFSRDWAEAVGMYPVEKHEGPQTRAVMFRDPVSRGILQSSHKPWEAETAAMAKVRHVKVRNQLEVWTSPFPKLKY